MELHGHHWILGMAWSGPEKIRAYGRYVGRRFKDHPNLIWIIGGDGENWLCSIHRQKYSPDLRESRGNMKHFSNTASQAIQLVTLSHGLTPEGVMAGKLIRVHSAKRSGITGVC